jgi:hypothetical protein
VEEKRSQARKCRADRQLKRAPVSEVKEEKEEKEEKVKDQAVDPADQVRVMAARRAVSRR